MRVDYYIALFAIIIININAQAYKTQFVNSTQVYIDAIFPCRIFFNASGYINCTSFAPGPSIIQSNWSNCFFTCCPGFKEPQFQNQSDINECFEQYKQRPNLVIIIAIVIVLLLLILFMIVPFVASNDDLFLKCYKCCFSTPQEEQKEKMIQNQIIVQQTQNKVQVPKDNEGNLDFLAFGLNQINKYLIQNQIIDDEPKQQRICQICQKGSSNLALICGHTFHKKCLIKKIGDEQQQNIKDCYICKRKDIFPARAYCRICSTKYINLQKIQLSDNFICKACDG